MSLRSEWMATDNYCDCWDKASETTSAVVFQRSEIRIVPSLIGIFEFGISADIFPSADDVVEFDSLIFSSCPSGWLFGGGLLICGCNLVTGGSGVMWDFGIGVWSIWAGTPDISTSIGSSSSSSGIGGVVNASCCLKRSVVLRAIDIFFGPEDFSWRSDCDALSSQIRWPCSMSRYCLHALPTPQNRLWSCPLEELYRCEWIGREERNCLPSREVSLEHRVYGRCNTCNDTRQLSEVEVDRCRNCSKVLQNWE